MVWDEVGDGCFRRRYRTFDLNIGVVRGSDALLVVDTRADLRQADELLDDLRWFGRPVRWVVNSHWHFDHVFGNQRFVERARGEIARAEAVDVSADFELWGHAELPATLLDSETELRATLRDFYGDDAGDEFDQVPVSPLKTHSTKAARGGHTHPTRSSTPSNVATQHSAERRELHAVRPRVSE